MTYAEFKSKYVAAFNAMMNYSPSMAGAGYYAEVMANLSDSYPEFADQVEMESA